MCCSIVGFAHEYQTRLEMTDSAGNTKGGKYHCTIDLLFDWFGISCMTTDNFCFYLQNRQIQTSQTGGQWYSDTSPFSIPCLNLRIMRPLSYHHACLQARVFIGKFDIISYQLGLNWVLARGMYCKTFYGCKLRIFVISQSVCLWQAFPA